MEFDGWLLLPPPGMEAPPEVLEELREAEMRAFESARQST